MINTNTLNTHHKIHQRSNNKGVALVIGLILLVVMTIFGLVGIRLVSGEERMVSQSYDRTLAFQAAEAALREAEILIETNKPTPVAGCAVAAGLMTCAKPAAADKPRWLDPTFASWQAATTLTAASGTITPDYFVEYLGDTFPCGFDPVASASGCKRYRITARALPGSGRASVLLQTVYATS
jgi:type IV pilus assembly protein PilX